MKAKAIYLTVVLAVLLGLVTSVVAVPGLPSGVTPAVAATISVPGNYNTIQEAIDAAHPGDTINVAAGTYTEIGQIVIDKDLSIIGADRSTTIIKPAGDTGTDGDARGWFLVNSGVVFNLSNMTLDGAGRLVSIAINSHGSGTIDNNIIQNMGYNPSGPDYAGRAIALWDANMTVRSNIIHNFGRIGVYVGSGVTAAVIDSNTITGKGSGDHLDYGVEVERGGVAEVTNNTISNCRGVASVDGSTSAAILATTYFAADTTTTVTITGNTITNNTCGITAGYDGTDTAVVTAHNNSIYGNDYGVDATSTTVTVNAENNWWGSRSGPAPTGTGDEVIGAVDYDPWLGVGPWYVATTGSDETGDGSYGNPWRTIQHAIDSATAGDTIQVAAGTYQESLGGWRDIEIFKSLSLIAAGSGKTIVELSGLQHGVEILPDAAGTVLIEGITFTNRTENTKSADWAVIVGETGGTFASLTFRDVEIAYAQARNLHLASATYVDVNITNCNIHDGGTWGFSARGTITDMSVTNSHFDNNGWYDASHGIGFDIDMPSSIASLTVTGGTFNNNEAKGINLVKTTNATFTNITASNNGGAPGGGFGVSLWEWAGTSSNLVFINPTLTNNTFDGFLIGSETGMTVSGITMTGGTITGNGRAGVFIYREAAWAEGVITNIKINEANISGNGAGVTVIMPHEPVDATNNSWGDATGPKNATSNPGGVGNAVSDSVSFIPWTDMPTPTVTSVNPDHGDQGQTLSVTITGTNFVGVLPLLSNGVSFGSGVSVTGFTVVSATQITASIDLVTTGAKDASVTNAVGTGTKTAGFTVTASGPIGTPTLVSPANGAIVSGTSVPFQWSSVPGAVKYKLLVSRSTGILDATKYKCNVDLVDTGSGLPTTYIDTGYPVNGTKYYWWVWAYAADGSSSVWAQVSANGRNFTNVPATFVAAPTLVSPANGAIVSGTSVPFQWSSVPGAVKYKLLVSRSTGILDATKYKCNVDLVDTGSGLPTTYVDTGYPANGTKYYWWVWAYATDGSYSLWSQVSANGRNFTNTPSVAAPTLVSPAYGASVSGTSVTFQWSSVPGAVKYRLLVSRSTGILDATKYKCNVDLVDTGSGLPTTYVDSGYPGNGTKYYWWVWAYAADGSCSLWSQVSANGRNFTSTP